MRIEVPTNVEITEYTMMRSNMVVVPISMTTGSVDCRDFSGASNEVLKNAMKDIKEIICIMRL